MSLGDAIQAHSDAGRRWTEAVEMRFLAVADDHDPTLPWPPVEVLRARAEASARDRQPELWTELWRCAARVQKLTATATAGMQAGVERISRAMGNDNDE